MYVESLKSKSLFISVGAAIIFSGITGTLLYFLLRKEDDTEELFDGSVKQRVVATVKVPISSVGFIIGRQGSNIKLIQEKTLTKIYFEHFDDKHRLCVIRGSEENVSSAKHLIINALESQPVVEEMEMFVPNNAVGKIIGRNGETITRISRTSGAKVKVENTVEASKHSHPSECDNMRRILLKGTHQQLETAKLSIEAVLKEVEEIEKQIKISTSHMVERSSLRRDGDSAQMKVVSHEDQDGTGLDHGTYFVKAFVSAVDNAGHFWLQIVDARAVKLDRLITAMTEYYSDKENQDFHRLEQVSCGDLVAAPFQHDTCWYRGQVKKVSNSSEGPSEVAVYYVDFGETETVPLNTCCQLRTDFLKLSYQAIECYLANVDLSSLESDEAAELFEELTYAAKWKVVMVRVIGYRMAEERSTPLVQIVDTSGPEDVDIAEELVKRNLAVSLKPVDDPYCCNEPSSL